MTDDTRIDILEKRLDALMENELKLKADLDLYIVDLEDMELVNERLTTLEDTQEGLVEVIKDILWKRIRRRANVVAAIFLVLLWAILYATGLFEIFFDYLVEAGELLYLGRGQDTFGHN